jgi:hypothetical protein
MKTILSRKRRMRKKRERIWKAIVCVCLTADAVFHSLHGCDFTVLPLPILANKIHCIECTDAFPTKQI